LSLFSASPPFDHEVFALIASVRGQVLAYINLGAFKSLMIRHYRIVAYNLNNATIQDNNICCQLGFFNEVRFTFAAFQIVSFLLLKTKIQNRLNLVMCKSF